MAALNWSDPADPAIWADPIRVDDDGHQRIADQLTELLRTSSRRDPDGPAGSLG